MLSIKMIEMSNLRLEDAIRKEVDENPALAIDYSDEQPVNEDLDFNSTDDYQKEGDDYEKEEVDDYQKDSFEDTLQDYYEQNELDDANDRSLDYETRNLNYSPDDATREHIVASDFSLQDNLKQQLGELNLSQEESQIAEYIIGCIDDSGYMTRDSQSIVNDLMLVYNIYTRRDEVDRIIREIIQELEPAGIGARHLQECLLLQLKRREQNEVLALAQKIVSEFFEDFSKRRYNVIINKLGVEQDLFSQALNEITKCDPRPAATTSQMDVASNTIIPDFLVTIEDGKLNLSLNNGGLPKLKIDDDFQQMFPQGERKDKEVEKFIKENVDKAQDFIDALSQREITLFKTMNVIIQLQKNYFLSGDDSDLKPMILKDVASKAGYDISTISRVSNSKYVQTFFGTFPVKHLFSEAVNEDVSSKEIKKILSDLVRDEDKHTPLTDDNLCEELKKRGYTLARRTVAKYRDELDIPVARMRKQL